MNDFMWGLILGGVIVNIPWMWWYHGNAKVKLDEWKRYVAGKIHSGDDHA